MTSKLYSPFQNFIHRYSFVALMLLVAVFSTIAVAPAHAQTGEGGDPDAVTELVCSGERAIVFQSEAEIGDGVTMALFEIRNGEAVATDDPCGDESNVWAFVEPWGLSNLNADAMYVGTWSEIAEVAAANDWPNGSGWIQEDPDEMLDHPLVVHADDVSSRSKLGLNPNEDQTQAARRGWVIDRALVLLEEAGMTPAEYCRDFDEKLADYLCGFDQFVEAEVEIARDSDFDVDEDCDEENRQGEALDVAASEEAGKCKYFEVPDDAVKSSSRNWWWYTWRIVVGLLLLGLTAQILRDESNGWWRLLAIIPFGLLVWLVWAAFV